MASRSSGGRVTISWDDSELKTLEINLTEAPGRVQRSAPKVVKRGADLIEKAMKVDARGHRYLPHFPRAVDQKMRGRWEAQIGFTHKPGTQGKLAHIILLGSINNLPVYDFRAAPRRVVPEILDMFGRDGEAAVMGAREDTNRR
jgi:hypothetical protein